MMTMETKTEVNVGKLLKVAKLIAEILGLVLSMLKRSGYGDEAKETVQNIVDEQEREEDEP